MSAGDGSRLEAAGIVLVRQRPGSAKGVLFVTLEDETGVANLVVWAKVFEANRRVLMSARMLAVRGHVQREGEVVHLVARRFTDLSADLASVGGRETSFPPAPWPRRRASVGGDRAPDPRELYRRRFAGATSPIRTVISTRSRSRRGTSGEIVGTFWAMNDPPVPCR